MRCRIVNIVPAGPVAAALFLVAGTVQGADHLADLIQKNLLRTAPEFPQTVAPNFQPFQEAAVAGDTERQERLFALVVRRVNSVYRPINELGGLLFSSRRLESGYDTAETNYALNLQELFRNTTDTVRINKRSFTVRSQSGMDLNVSMPKYSAADGTVEVSDGNRTGWIHLDGLEEKDRLFYKSALVDRFFMSTRNFIISSETGRRRQMEGESEDQVDFKDKSYGDRFQGAFSSVTLQKMDPTILLENRGPLPVDRLLVEYQAFARQTVMRLPRDFPSEYRLAGLFVVERVGPGETVELHLDLPAIVTERPEAIDSADGWVSYTRIIPSDQNPLSEGRMGGLWVRVHRITPYGERLTREVKTAGVPSLPWENVAPVRADLR